MNWITQHLTGWLVAALPIGTITFAVGQYVKKASTWVDQQNPNAKRLVIIPAIAAAVTALGVALHVPIVCVPDQDCLSQLTGPTLDVLVKGGLGIVVAWITHAGKDGNTKTG